MKIKPQRPSADITRLKIIQSALKLFMQYGYAGTAISQIAEKANINQTLIFHHFTNKQTLWKQVKAAIIESVQVDEINATPKNLAQFIAQAIEQRVNMYKQSPALKKLIIWQKLESPKLNLIDIPDHPLSPLQWKQPIEYLQKHKMLNLKWEPEAIIILLSASIDAMIVDDLSFFKSSQKDYSKMLIDVFSKGF